MINLQVNGQRTSTACFELIIALLKPRSLLYPTILLIYKKRRIHAFPKCSSMKLTQAFQAEIWTVHRIYFHVDNNCITSNWELNIIIT